jgi:hypothetical protein
MESIKLRGRSAGAASSHGQSVGSGRQDLAATSVCSCPDVVDATKPRAAIFVPFVAATFFFSPFSWWLAPFAPP